MVKKKKKVKINQGTFWFLAILIISVITALPQITIDPTIIILILGICGAVVAILNIRKGEETDLLVATTALVVIVTIWLLGLPLDASLSKFFLNLVVAFGVAGFIVALARIAKVGIDY